MLRIFKGALAKAYYRWASFAEERQNLMNAMRKVAGSWLMMELGMAFRKWLAWWDNMCEQRDLVRKVMGRIRNSQMFGLWNFWRELCETSKRAREALVRFTKRNLAAAFISWLDICAVLKEKREAAERARRAAEFAPDAWLMGPDFSYGGETASRQFLGVVEIGKEDLSMVPEAVDWDMTGRRDHGAVEWDRSGREILSPIAERGLGDDLDASELLRQRMQTMNAMFDEVESMTLDLEREMFQPTETRPNHRTRKQLSATKKISPPHDGRWPAPVRESEMNIRKFRRK